MAGPEKKAKPQKEEIEVDPETFLFEEDDEEDDFSDLPPERELADIDDDVDEEDDDDIDIEDDDDDW
jgi:hypothetical protein